MTFYVPAAKFEQHIRDSPIWKLGNVGRKTPTANGGLGLLDRGGSSGSIRVDGGSGEGDGGEGESAVNGEGEDEDDLYDGPEKFLLPIKYLTDPGNRDNEELRAWASSAPEMKDVSQSPLLFLSTLSPLSFSLFVWDAQSISYESRGVKPRQVHMKYQLPRMHALVY